MLSKGLKPNHSLTKLSLSSINFLDLSLFYKLSESITLNEALTYIDLSHNNLDDSTSNSLLELLGVLPYLKYLNLDCNKLRDISWGNILAVNNSLEQLYLNYNLLKFESVSNLLEALMVNRNLKVLGLLGCENNGVFSQKIGFLLANVLKNSVLQSLIIEIEEKYEGLSDLATSLCEYNNELLEIGFGEDWKKVNDKKLRTIWRAIQANR